eukprot:7768874-Alexandrium_andersonii.AAC.1
MGALCTLEQRSRAYIAGNEVSEDKQRPQRTKERDETSMCAAAKWAALPGSASMERRTRNDRPDLPYQPHE